MFIINDGLIKLILKVIKVYGKDINLKIGKDIFILLRLLILL